MDEVPHDRIDDSLIALRRILRATESFSRELAQSAGVTPAQLRVLQIVEQRDGVIPKALAQQMRAALVKRRTTLKQGSQWKKWDGWTRCENFRVYTPPPTLELVDQLIERYRPPNRLADH